MQRDVTISWNLLPQKDRVALLERWYFTPREKLLTDWSDLPKIFKLVLRWVMELEVMKDERNV